LAAVKFEGQWGYIDKSGTYEIHAAIREAGSFEDGFWLWFARETTGVTSTNRESTLESTTDRRQLYEEFANRIFSYSLATAFFGLKQIANILDSTDGSRGEASGPQNLS
jgi:hypothetical protein